MKKQRSIRSYLIGNLILILMVSLTVVGISDFQISEFLRTSINMFRCEQELGNFYVSADAMDYAAREYVYTSIEDNHVQYEIYEKEARNSLAECRKNVDAEMENRLLRLEAMLDYYAEPLVEYLNGKVDKYSTYTLLQYRGRLIADTSTHYYELLSESLSEKMLNVQTQWNERKIILAIILILVVLISALWGIHYWKSIYTPIQIMVENTKKIKREDYALETPNTTISELNVLENAFADMAVRIEKDIGNLQEKARLEQELLKQENENLIIKNLMAATEFQNLQAQINPHFLFNTMNMISQSAYLHNDIQTSEMMDKLSAFLRYTLDKADQVSTLQEEILSIENYIYIQQKRFGSRVKFIVDIPEGIPNVAMPPVIIQPLVENAITHGVKNVTSKAEIVVSAYVDEESLHIYVEDNGVGMNEEKLEELQVYLHRATAGIVPSTGSSIGLANVCKRLKFFYGEELEFVVESEEDCGTIVAIAIPREVWNEQ